MCPEGSIGPRTQRSPPDLVLDLVPSWGRGVSGPRMVCVLRWPGGTREEEEEEEAGWVWSAVHSAVPRIGGGLKEAAYCRGPSPAFPCLVSDPLGSAIASGVLGSCSWG